MKRICVVVLLCLASSAWAQSSYPGSTQKTRPKDLFGTIDNDKRRNDARSPSPSPSTPSAPPTSPSPNERPPSGSSPAPASSSIFTTRPDLSYDPGSLYMVSLDALPKAGSEASGAWRSEVILGSNGQFKSARMSTVARHPSGAEIAVTASCDFDKPPGRRSKRPDIEVVVDYAKLVAAGSSAPKRLDLMKPNMPFPYYMYAWTVGRQSATSIAEPHSAPLTITFQSQFESGQAHLVFTYTDDRKETAVVSNDGFRTAYEKLVPCWSTTAFWDQQYAARDGSALQAARPSASVASAAPGSSRPPVAAEAPTGALARPPAATAAREVPTAATGSSAATASATANRLTTEEGDVVRAAKKLAKDRAADAGDQFDPDAPLPAKEVKRIVSEVRAALVKLEPSLIASWGTTPTDKSKADALRDLQQAIRSQDCTVKNPARCANLVALLSGQLALRSPDVVPLRNRLYLIACLNEDDNGSCRSLAFIEKGVANGENERAHRARALGYYAKSCAANSGDTTRSDACGGAAACILYLGCGASDKADIDLADSLFQIACNHGDAQWCRRRQVDIKEARMKAVQNSR